MRSSISSFRCRSRHKTKWMCRMDIPHKDQETPGSTLR
jgi:hypothetical protein